MTHKTLAEMAHRILSTPYRCPPMPPGLRRSVYDAPVKDCSSHPYWYTGLGRLRLRRPILRSIPRPTPPRHRH